MPSYISEFSSPGTFWVGKSSVPSYVAHLNWKHLAWGGSLAAITATYSTHHLTRRLLPAIPSPRYSIASVHGSESSSHISTTSPECRLVRNSILKDFSIMTSKPQLTDSSPILLWDQCSTTCIWTPGHCRRVLHDPRRRLSHTPYWYLWNSRCIGDRDKQVQSSFSKHVRQTSLDQFGSRERDLASTHNLGGHRLQSNGNWLHGDSEIRRSRTLLS